MGRRVRGRQRDERARECLTPGIQRGQRGRNSATIFSKGVAHFEWAVSDLTAAYEAGRGQIASAALSIFSEMPGI